MPKKLPMAFQYVYKNVPAGEVAELLLNDLYRHYSQIGDLQWADLGAVWHAARDLVVSVDRWARKIGGVPGEKKMDIAVGVALQFLEDRGGARSIETRARKALDKYLPGFFARLVVGFLPWERLTEAAVRFVLELAVRELRGFA